jgi:hypothetical protein
MHRRTLDRQILGFMTSIQLTMDDPGRNSLADIDQSIESIKARMQFVRQYAQACIEQRAGSAG